MKRIPITILAVMASLWLCSLSVLALPEGAVGRLGKGEIGEGDRAIAFSPDGAMLAVATSIGVWLYDSSDLLEEIALLEMNAQAVVFSLDGSLLASGSRDGAVRLWDVQSHREIATLIGHLGDVTCVAFSPDGSLLASGGLDEGWDYTVRLWDVQSHQEVATLTGHFERVSSVAFSPDGSLLGSGSGNTVKLWDVESHQEVASLRHSDSVSSVAFSPDGSLLASGSSDDMVRLWDVQSRQEVALLTGHSDSVSSVAFSPDGSLLASGSGDIVKVWDVESHQEVASLRHSQGVSSVAFSPDGNLLASGSGGDTVKLWDVGSCQEVASLERPVLDEVFSVVFSPDSRLLAIGGHRRLELWDVASCGLVATLEGPTGGEDRSFEVYSVSFSPDGRLLASGGPDGVKLWDVESHQEVATLSNLGRVSSLDFSPDGSLLACAPGTIELEEGGIGLWDVESRQEVAALEDQNVEHVAFSPDGRLLASGGEDGTLKLWDVEGGQEIATFAVGAVTSVALSPDGSLLASGGGVYGPYTITLWDVESRQEITTFEVPGNWIIPVAFSTDGKILAYSCGVGVVLWDIESRQEIRTFEGRGLTFAFSPDGRLLASGIWDDKTVLLWDMTPYMPSAPPEVVAVSITEGQEIFPNATITVTFGQEMETVNISVTGAEGTTTIVGRTATWTPTGYMPPGPHTLTVDGTDVDGQRVVESTPINFTALVPDTTAPEIADDKCNPKNGATDVDPDDYLEELHYVIVFSEVMSEVRVTAVDPEFYFDEELSGDTLTVTSYEDNMPKETKYTITLAGKDLAGNDLATTQYSFTTMPKGRNVELVGSYDIPGLADDIAVVDNHAYIIESDYFGSEDVLRVLDVSIPSAPSEIGSCQIPAWLIYGVAVVDSYAYTVEPTKGGSLLHVIDVSTPSSPSEVASCWTHGGWAWGVTVVDNYAYIADGPRLSVIDISIPSSPSNIGFCETSPGTCGNCSYDAAVVGDYAYITVGGPTDELPWVGGFSVVDVSTPSAPFEVAFHEIGGHGIAVEGNYAYIAGGSGLRIVDISTPLAPSEVGYYQTGGSSEITIVGNYAYVVGSSGLHIIDVSTPSAPSEVGYYEVFGGSGFSVNGDLIYVVHAVDGGSGMSILRYTGDVVVSVESSGKLPTMWGRVKTHLYQNYPNPFNPETWIPYQLAQDSPVTIRIYNAKGQIIRTITLGNQNAGIYLTKGKAAHWDGRNETGEEVASGIYFYNIAAGDFSATRKMVAER